MWNTLTCAAPPLGPCSFFIHSLLRSFRFFSEHRNEPSEKPKKKLKWTELSAFAGKVEIPQHIHYGWAARAHATQTVLNNKCSGWRWTLYTCLMARTHVHALSLQLPGSLIAVYSLAHGPRRQIAKKFAIIKLLILIGVRTHFFSFPFVPLQNQVASRQARSCRQSLEKNSAAQREKEILQVMQIQSKSRTQRIFGKCKFCEFMRVLVSRQSSKKVLIDCLWQCDVNGGEIVDAVSATRVPRRLRKNDSLLTAPYYRRTNKSIYLHVYLKLNSQFGVIAIESN